MLVDLRDFLLLTDAGWWVGTGLIIGGIAVLAVFAWRNLGDVQAMPRKLTDPPPRWAPLHRAGVVPRIPGATPQAGPVCPVCGAAWHGPVCPPKERTDETVQLPPVGALAPQLVALSRFFEAVDAAREDTDKAMGRIVDDLAGRTDDDCPLTTQEIPPLLDAPDFAATVRGDTVELSGKVKKILEAHP